MRPKLGYVGLGNIGEPVVRHLLQAGYEVLVHDTRAEAVARLDDTSAEPVGDPKVLASAADVVLLSLPNSTIVEEVVKGGIMQGFCAGKVLIDTSSSRPSSTRALAKELAERGADMLDAPVSGGVLRAKEGTLSVMVGGKREVFERCSPILEAFGDKIFHVGDHGAGHLVKSLNNLLSATTLASAAEALILAQRAGISPETFVEAINAGNGRSYSTEVKLPRYVLDGSFDDGFALGLMVKDLKIALETAGELGLPMLVGSTLGQVWQAAGARGYGAEGHTAIYAFLEEFAGRKEEL